uniref:Uncharacterized protein n=1 Tax=Anguilla anguilla TaxID=7936 RepID=A0A0E9XF68_ANGAN
MQSRTTSYVALLLQMDDFPNISSPTQSWHHACCEFYSQWNPPLKNCLLQFYPADICVLHHPPARIYPVPPWICSVCPLFSQQ